MPSMSWRAIEIASRLLLRRTDLRVEGIEHVPARGPVVIAARHYHHLYDGPALICALDRPISIVVALDWIKQRPLRRLMQRLCDQLDWPTVIRPDRSGTLPSAEARATLLQATRQTVELLRRNAVVVIFPEGYPNIDPGYTPKSGVDAFLPFQPGVVRLAALAATPDTPVLIVPAGFCYRSEGRTSITLRFGPPIAVTDNVDQAAVLRQLEAEVRRLSSADQPEYAEATRSA